MACRRFLREQLAEEPPTVLQSRTRAERSSTVVDYQLWSEQGRHILTLAHHWASRNITQRHFSYTSCSTWQPPPHAEALLEFGPQRQGGVGEANTRFKKKHTLPAGMATGSHWLLCASGCATFSELTWKEPRVWYNFSYTRSSPPFWFTDLWESKYYLMVCETR